MTVGDVLARLVAALEVQSIPYMVTGSFASALHGQARSTQDIDVVVDPAPGALDRLLDGLSSEAYYVDRDVAREAFTSRGMFNIIDLATGWKVDVIIRKARPFSREEIARRRPGIIDGVSVYVASPEDTVIAKLEWSKAGGGSERQRRDVAEIIATQRATLDRAYIERWVAELGLDDEWALVRG
jgi:hypothetical protein